VALEIVPVAHHLTVPEAAMNQIKLSRVFVYPLILVVFATMTMVGQTTQDQSTSQKDSASGTRIGTVDEMAKRVDSLQFIVVYNAELLRRNLDSKMMLIFVMLGIIIVASVLMYALLRQIQQQRKELEDKLFHQLASSVADLESKIKASEMKPPPPKPATRKKKTK
jgi:hypothetical protein